jgi:hypothetical protein
LTRVTPSDPWPDHLTGSGFKTMIPRVHDDSFFSIQFVN